MRACCDVQMHLVLQVHACWLLEKFGNQFGSLCGCKLLCLEERLLNGFRNDSTAFLCCFAFGLVWCGCCGMCGACIMKRWHVVYCSCTAPPDEGCQMTFLYYVINCVDAMVGFVFHVCWYGGSVCVVRLEALLVTYSSTPKLYGTVPTLNSCKAGAARQYYSLAAPCSKRVQSAASKQ
jgi:hypothetical protein